MEIQESRPHYGGVRKRSTQATHIRKSNGRVLGRQVLPGTRGFGLRVRRKRYLVRATVRGWPTFRGVSVTLYVRVWPTGAAEVFRACTSIHVRFWSTGPVHGLPCTYDGAGSACVSRRKCFFARAGLA